MSNLVMAEGWKENISPGEKLVLIALCDQANDAGECFVLVSTLQVKCSMGERTIQDNLKRLETRGLLVREFRKGRSTIFHLLPARIRTPADSAPTPADSAPTPADSAPTPADSAPTPADSAPITITYPLPNHVLTINTPLPPAAKKTKPQAAKGLAVAAVIDLPDCITPKIWQQVIAHRKTKKQPVTELALQSVADHLEKLHATGNDLQEVVAATIRANYPDFYPTRKPPAQLAVVNGKAPYAPVNHATGGDHATVSRF